MVASLALAFVLAAGPVAGSAPGVVRGEVRSAATGLPLPFALVEVVGDGPWLATVTDSIGRYLLRDVPAGKRLLRARHIDHGAHEVEVLVPVGGEVLLDLVLDLRPITLPPITARSKPPPGVADTIAVRTAELGPASVRVLESTPGLAELGLTEGGGAPPPGQEPGDPADLLYVRGAVADMKLVLLDGAPVFTPFHLGGLISAFEPAVLRDARLYVGGASARYDGGLSYVMDLETRAGRREHTRSSGAIDLLGARAMVEGPLTHDAGYLVMARGIHGLGATEFLRESFPYGYADALGRFDVPIGEAGVLGITGFWNREAVRFDSAVGGDGSAAWGNTAGSIRYRGPLLDAETEITVAYGHFAAELPVGGDRPLVSDGTSDRVRVAADFLGGEGRLRWNYGVSYDYLETDYRAWPRGASEELTVREASTNGSVAGAYLDGGWQILPRVRVRGGVRADLFSEDPGPRLAPRVAATWLVAERVALTLAAGRYRQYIRTPDRPVRSGEEIVDEPDPERKLLAVAHASHVVMALDQDLGEGVRLGLDGFFKAFDGLPSADQRPTQASGLDLWIRRVEGGLTGWVGYSLAWLWSVGTGPAAEDIFAGRHLISAGVNGPVGPRGKFQIRFAYGAGLPYTAVPELNATEPPALPLENVVASVTGGGGGGGPLEGGSPLTITPEQPYLRLDAEVSHTWSPRWGGVSLELTPYLRVLNALDRRNTLFYYFDVNQDAAPRALASLPVLPVVGMEWRF